MKKTVFVVNYTFFLRLFSSNRKIIAKAKKTPTRSEILLEKMQHLKINMSFSSRKVVYRQKKNIRILVKPIHCSLRLESKTNKNIQSHDLNKI